MAVSIQDQLRDYADQVTSESIPGDLDQSGELFRPPVTQTIGTSTELPTHSVISTRPVRLVAVFATVAALVLVGTVAVLSGATRPEPSVAATPIVDSAASLDWSRVPYSEGAFGEEFEQYMVSVTAGGPGLVAVGGAADPFVAREGRAAVWTSVDGRTWSRVPHAESVFGATEMMSVTAGGPGLVAVGESDGAGRAWTSPDGFTWSRVPHNEALSGALSMKSVTVGGPGLVAVGWDGGEWQGYWGNAVVWTSPDGVTWSRVPHNEAIFGGGWVGMVGVTAGGPGLVAVGGEWVDEIEGSRAVVWTSPDGFTWSRVPHNQAVFGNAEMSGVTAGGPGLVAFGSADEATAVWTSPDGFTWSRVPSSEAVFGGADMSAVTVGGPGLVAVGTDSQGAVAWTSADGITWSRVPHSEEVFGAGPYRLDLRMTSVAASGHTIVAVGSHAIHNNFQYSDSEAAVWVAVPED